MKTPVLITNESYQKAWAQAIYALSENSWDTWNLVVQITNPLIHYESFHELMTDFALKYGYIIPRHVENTIFPSFFYKKHKDRDDLYKAYWKYFKMTRSMPHSGWGTYFQRMIRYETPQGTVDQLGSIIDNINNREINYQASHTMIIPYPHKDRNKLMGAPCLNYVTVQVENSRRSPNGLRISLLAVYRNHDFTERAYGNYSGLCNLLIYICEQTNSAIGSVTCVSSHAYVPNKKKRLTELASILSR